MARYPWLLALLDLRLLEHNLSAILRSLSKEDYDAVKADNQDVFAETERVMMERLDSYKGINKTSQHIKRFSDSANSTEKKKASYKEKEVKKRFMKIS